MKQHDDWEVRMSQEREDVLIACHALGAHGLGGVIGGHVSIRVPGERAYWTNVLDKTFEETTFEDIVKLDFEGNQIAGDRKISPGIGFHHGIYMHRPDVNAVVHTHGFWVTAQSAFARPPKMWHNLCTYFWKKTAVAPDDTIEAIAPALSKDDVAIIIPWHGAITVGNDIGHAAALHATFDYACKLDVTMGATSAEPMPESQCAHMRSLIEKADYLRLTWNLMKRRVNEANIPSLV
jgi:L-fuculose-phosphate aldolase